MEDMVAYSELYPYIPRLAYCNLRIQYQMLVRDTVSKQILAPSLPSFNDVRSYFQSVQDVWSESQACVRLQAMVKAARPQCNEIISFALGSLTQEFQRNWPPRSAFQHALVVSLRDALRSYQPQETVVCSVQDPAYTDLDESLLSDSNINAVYDPEGFLRLSDTSAVLSCSPDIPVKEVVLELANPALMIWDTIRENVFPGMSRSDPDSPRESVSDHMKQPMKFTYREVRLAKGNSYMISSLSFACRVERSWSLSSKLNLE
nr:hypothetical protein CFP56_65892 [Quercus suber]